MTFYNEHDPKAAAWLRELIAAGHIANGIVDERSITDITARDLEGYTQCHFFAGIGGWSLALRLAGWPDSRPVWTGSCPCQPFSVAGKGLGEKDERHLWPVLRELIRECSPSVVFGEQVAAKAGRDWLHGVRFDLEGMAYAVGSSDLCAAGVGAPHIRQRLYWVAYPEHSERRPFDLDQEHEFNGNDEGWEEAHGQSRACGEVCGLADADGGDTRAEREQCSREQRLHPQGGGTGFWDSYELLPCLDGKARRIEPGSFPLAHGVSGRVGLLRGYGNAIVPPLAAEFVGAFVDCLNAHVSNEPK